MRYAASLIFLFLTTALHAQTLTTTVETTTVTTDASVNSVSFMQLVSTIRGFNGQEIRVDGELYLNEITRGAVTIVTANEVIYS